MIIKGKSKDLLEDSITNALLAVEIYNINIRRSQTTYF